MPAWLENIDHYSFRTAPFPKADVLRDSLYYPASGNDGSPVRHWSFGVSSFVYVDTVTTQQQHLSEIQQSRFAGYKTWDTRHIDAKELTPAGWQLRLPPGIDREQYIAALNMAHAGPANSFAQWTIFERLKSHGDGHGPKRFSFLFVRGEGAASYQALYVSNNVLPKVLAIIRPGTGYGGNYPDFIKVLLATMNMHTAGLPQQLLHWYMVADPALTLLDRGGNNPLTTEYDLKNIGQSWSKDGERDFRLAIFPRY